MKRRIVLLIIFSAFLVVAGGGLVGAMLVPAGFNVAETKEWIRRRHPDLFNNIKRTIIEYDKDVTAIGKTRKLPLFRLVMSRKDVVHFANLYAKFEDSKFGPAFYAEHNIWRNAVLEYEGSVYDVKIKSHGRNPDAHRNGRNISLSVQLKKGQQIDNCRRFSLLVRDHFKADKQLVYDMAQRFGVLVNQERLVRVAINNWDEKLYFFDRRFDDTYMELNRRPSMRIFGYSDSPTEATVKSSVYTEGHFDPIQYRARFLKTLGELEYPVAQHEPLCARFLEFNRAIAECRVDDVQRFFDVDYISSFEAVRLITALNGHFACNQGNLYVFYDLANGLFYPAFTRDCNMTAMKIPDGGTAEWHVNKAYGWPLPMFWLISQDDRIRQETYRKVYDFIASEQGSIGERQRCIREYYEKLSYYGWSLVALRRLGFNADDFLSHNMAVLKKYLEESASEVSISTAGNQLVIEILPKSMAAIRIDKLTITPEGGKFPDELMVQIKTDAFADGRVSRIAERELRVAAGAGRLELGDAVKELSFSTGLDGESLRLPRKYTVAVTLKGDDVPRFSSENVAITLSNTITNQQFDPVQVHRHDGEESVATMLRTSPAVSAPRDAWARWRERYPQLDVTRTTDGRMILHRGDYILEQDVLVPKGLRLVIEAGTTLRLAATKALVSYNGIDVNGTQADPVTITSIDPQEPFGCVGVLGDENTRSTIRHLHISNGYERWVDGVYFSGALSVHDNGNVQVLDSIFELNHADDGLNIKYGDVWIQRCQFNDNAADQVDLDVCMGAVTDSSFLMEHRRDANGDGLDVSGSTMVVRNCRFVGLRDKGLSVGEDSGLLCQANSFLENTVGVAVKDHSDVYLIGNAFENNVVDIDGFQKKTIFGGGHVYLGLGPGENHNLRIYVDEVSVLRAFRDAPMFRTLDLKHAAAALVALSQVDWVRLAPTVESEPSWRTGN